VIITKFMHGTATFSALTPLVGCQHPACTKLNDEVLEFCLQQGENDLHMVQLMPLPPHHLLLHQNPHWFNLSGACLHRLCW